MTNINGSWATYNLYGLDAIGQIRRSGTTWNRFYFLKDHLGSVRVTVDASGNVVSYDDYYPFGTLMYGRIQDSSSVDGRYKFTGKEWDAETKYDYFGARYYDARIGRFLTVDSLSDDERLIGWSPYHYGYNSPVRFIELFGMQAKGQEEANRLQKKSAEHLRRAITISPGVSLGIGLKLRKGPLKLQFTGTMKQVEHKINLAEGKTFKESKGLGLEGSVKGIGIRAGKEDYIVKDEYGKVQDIHRDTGPAVKGGVIGPVELSEESLSIEIGAYALMGLSIEINLVELAKSFYYDALARNERTKDPEYLKQRQLGGTK